MLSPASQSPLPTSPAAMPAAPFTPPPRATSLIAPSNSVAASNGTTNQPDTTPPWHNLPRHDARAAALECAADFRRQTPRHIAELLLVRADLLAPDDAAILDACFNRGLNVAQVARIREVPVTTLRRRLRRLIFRVVSPYFEFVLRTSDHWPLTRRRVARAVVLEGRSLREAADALDLPIHAVRLHANAVRAAFDASRLIPQPPHHAAASSPLPKSHTNSSPSSPIQPRPSPRII
jgi:DNA-directed RNA polymerase specialized sigma24 family protein